MQPTNWGARLVLATASIVLFVAAVPASAQQAGTEDEGTTMNQPDSAMGQSAELPPPPPSWQDAGSPQLACGVRAAGRGLRATAAGTFTCWIAGAPAGDTTFSVHAMRIVDEAGSSTRPIGPICGTGTLVDGNGVCSGTLTDQTGPLFGGLLIEATLQPSGTRLGPVHIAPTLAGA